MSTKLVFVFCVLTHSLLPAQNTRNGALLGTGYRIPTGLITAAPGQLTMISVSGIASKPTNPIRAIPTSIGYPRELNGIQVRITQSGGAPMEAGLVAVQQTGCPTPAGNCIPATSITLLIPETLDTDSGRWFDRAGTLAVMDGATAVAEFPFRAVSDNLHIMNSCDATLVFMSIFVDAPNASACLPNVLQDQRLVNTNNPIRPGSGVASYLYGGGTSVVRDDPFGRAETVQTFDLHFDYRPNAPGSRAVPGFGLTGKPFLSVAYQGGHYQVNFMVPPIPDGLRLPACGGAISSNLTITISGENSMDSASFCVEP
ncbi:MAG: hypothetical protein ACKV2U_20650 [Bryobacteraceae bacterium]